MSDRKFDTSVIREAIAAAVEAHGKGLRLPKEMPIEPRTDPKFIRNAPSFGTVTESVTVAHPYTVEALAKFLGFVKAKSATATNSFIAAFGAEELIADNVLKESQIRGLSAERLGELVISIRKQRDAARIETARLAAEAEKRVELLSALEAVNKALNEVDKVLTTIAPDKP
jgi:hypothetical protein